MKSLAATALVAAGFWCSALTAEQSVSFTVVEASIADLRTAMESGRVTSRHITEQYLARIAKYQNTLKAALHVNARALEEADARDRERAAGKVRGPLHGVPIAIKDNIHTTDMPTTGGALVFEGFIPPYEATVTATLREAGAVIIAKTGMTELANWIAGAPTPMVPNYNAVHGFGMNPYDPRTDPRPLFLNRPVMAPGGSSSGIGTSANLWAGNVGTETSGSILSPSSQTMLVGIKPTVGRISRYGVIPISADQDTPGPMAKTVTDAALMLGALEGAAPDPRDAATRACTPPAGRDYTRNLTADGLRGARIGIPRAMYYSPTPAPGRTEPRGGMNPVVAPLVTEAIEILRKAGAVIVDPADIPSVVDTNAASNVQLWEMCNGANRGRDNDKDCSIVLKYGMKRDFNAWLASLGPKSPVKSLTELRRWNTDHRDQGAIQFGQANLDISDEMDLERDRERYLADRAKDVFLNGTHGIEEVMRAQKLDALLFPGGSGAAIAARPGYPTVIVPLGFVPNTLGGQAPAGFEPKPQPYGLSFTGLPCSESTLLRLAYAFEQLTKRRVPPSATP